MLEQSKFSESFIVRDMLSSDLSSVLAIERHAQISPWSRLSFEESLTREHQCRVIEIDARETAQDRAVKEIAAYHIVCAVADELHILNLVASPSRQGLGWGHCLMQDIFELADKQQLARLFLEVRASNAVAQQLYQKWQFKQIGVRKGYYNAAPDSPAMREDALIYLRQL